MRRFLLALSLSAAWQPSLAKTTPAYELAHGCYSIQHPKNQRYLSPSSSSSRPHFHATTLEAAHTYYFQPTGLGTFLLYSQEGLFLSSRFIFLQQEQEPSRWVEWALSFDRNQGSAQDDKVAVRARAARGDIGGKIGADTNWVLIRRSARDCRSYPEAGLNAYWRPDTAEVVDDQADKLQGYADLHVHFAFPKALGGLAMAGGVFHPYGVEHALSDCKELHGEGGKHNLLELRHQSPDKENQGSGYSTLGFPHFEYWPNRTTDTHIQAYYKWIERAYLGGLRLAVTHVTGNPTFCQLLHLLKIGKAKAGCSSFEAVEAQVGYIRMLEQYIDAQSGGPGRGWFRVVMSPQEAREVIRSGRLAVVLGAEHGVLFDCAESNKGCDEGYIHKHLDALQALGVRSVFPIHRFDNAFGGTRPQGGSAGAWMHLSSKLSTGKVNTLLDLVNPAKLLFKPIEGRYWDIATCPDGVQGTASIKSMQQFIDEDFAFVTKAAAALPAVGPVVEKTLHKIFLDKLNPLPAYDRFQKNARACNQQGLRPAGRYLLEQLMKRGMLVEIDHMSYPTLLDSLELLEAQAYPGVVSSHGWLENSAEIRQRILSLGGMIALRTKTPRDFIETVAQGQQVMQGLTRGFVAAIGTDIQGLMPQGQAEPGLEVRYPFVSIDGKAMLERPATGVKSFEFSKEGVAHYGLLPEWFHQVELLDQKAQTGAVAAALASAAAYIEMWERAEAVAAGFER